MSEPIITSKERSKHFDLIAIVAVLIVVGIIVANTMNKSAEEPADSDEVDVSVPSDGAGSAPEVVIPTSTNFQMPTELAASKRMEEIINETQGKSAATGDLEQIVYGIVSDTQKKDTVYFATSSNNPKGNFVGIYEQNIKTYEWERVYKDALLPTENGTPRIHVLAKEGRTLIVAFDHLDDLLGNCESAWLKHADSLKTLNLDAPRDGLKAYSLPSSLRSSEEASVAACKTE